MVHLVSKGYHGRCIKPLRTDGAARDQGVREATIVLVAVGVASRVVVCCCYFWLCGTFGCRCFVVLLLCARV